MKKGKITSILAAVWVFGFVSNASAQLTAERWFAYTGSWPDNYKILVSILVSGSSETEVLIAETPPAGWEIDAKASKGTVADGVVAWSGTSFKKVLTYYVTPPERAVGEAVFSGKVGEQTITGKNSITLGRMEPGVQIALKTGLYYNYLLYLPPSYDSSKKFPVILHLHTWSERGTSLETVRNFGIAKIVNNPNSIRELFGEREFPFILVSPQCPSNNDTWRESELLTVLDEVLANYAVDRDRIYMTGNSFGGGATWNFACLHPDLLAAISPISGGNPSKTQLQNLVGAVSVWSFHNKNDSTTSSSGQITAVKNLQDLGGDAQITLYEGTSAHDAWTKTYSNPEFYTWLLQHGKKPAAVADWMIQNQ